MLTAFLFSRLVLETLDPLPGDRKCFRMINGVLVERTVKDVIPALNTNSDGLKKVLDELVKQYKRQQDEMEKWKVGSQSLWLQVSSWYHLLRIKRILLTELGPCRKRITFKLFSNSEPANVFSFA